MLFHESLTFKFIAAAIGISLIFLDQSCLSIILYPICKSLSLDKSYISIIASAYTLGMFSFILFAGQLIDQFGWQKAYMVGLVIFALASLGCTISNDGMTLLISRFVQGIGAGLILPSAYVLANIEFPSSKQGSVMGAIIGLGSISFVLAPIIASQVINYLSWRSIFFVNIPFCILAGLFIFKSHPKIIRKKFELTKIDFMGWFLLLISIINVIASFLVSEKLKLIFEILACLSGITFLYVEFKSLYPIFNFKIFRNKKFFFNNGILFLIQINITSVIFWALLLQQIYKVPTSMLGIVLLPCFLPALILSKISGILYDKYGEKPIYIFSLISISLGLMALSSSLYLWREVQFIVGMAFYGVGTSLIIPVLNTASLSSVEINNKGLAAGVLQTTRQICGAISTILLSWIFLDSSGTVIANKFYKCYFFLAILILAVVSILWKFYNFRSGKSKVSLI